MGIRWLHPPQIASQTQPLTGNCAIGRGAGAEIVLDHETISRRHAEVSKAGLAYAIRDLGSKNGLFCNGLRTDIAQLESGQVIRLGDCVAVIGDFIASDVGFRELAPDLLGSRVLAQAVELTRRAARSDVTILLCGETGTGKELFARLIHRESERSGKFVAVNCAALSEHLFEAELFGHERGAFTGAHRARLGFIREASGGTLFLDEIGELPLPAQAKLLRVLEAREVVPVGAVQPLAVDLRVVCATLADLPVMVDQGRFRADLFGRLDGVRTLLPPLRARREDIPELFARFVEHYRGGTRPDFSASFIEGLCCYDWPRNVRQLRLLAEHLSAVLGTQSQWHRRDLLQALPELNAATPRACAAVDEAAPPREGTKLDREELRAALLAARGNVTLAARKLSVAKQTLYKHLALAGIDLGEFRESAPPPTRAEN